MNGNSARKWLATSLAMFLVGIAVALGGALAQAHAATCHSAYYVYSHVVPAHRVKATAKHSSYVIGAHSISGHWIYANCK